MDINNINNLIPLILYLSKNVELKYVVYKNTKFENQKNNWNETNSKYSCNGYFECDFEIIKCHQPIIINNNKRYKVSDKKNIKYEVMLNNSNLDIETYNFDILKDKKIKKRLIHILENLPSLDDKVICDKKLTFVNDAGFNKDHRGSDHTKIVLDFNDIYTFRPKTIRDICEAILRIKSHKFDNWYELFINCYEEKDENNKEIIIHFDFDHGS
jgi:hypothetical protein